MALLIAGVILIAGLVRQQFGSAGLYVVAAISGLADVDAITISSARVAGEPEVASRAILIAVASNSAAKAAMASWIGGTRVGRQLILPTLLAVLAGAAVHVLA
jgi:uncharacterized membrane protein (DUF4010 family)